MAFWEVTLRGSPPGLSETARLPLVDAPALQDVGGGDGAGEAGSGGGCCVAAVRQERLLRSAPSSAA